jgi:putative membrane protein
MKRLILTVASSLALAACGTSDNGSNSQDLQSDGAVDKMGTVDNQEKAQGQAQAADNAQLYVPEAAISDLFEIESSRLALQKSQSAKVKVFAKQMIADHTATTNALKPLLANQEIARALPTELDPRHQAMLDSLKALSGAAFDKTYLEQQATAHQEALLLHANYAKHGDKEALKTFATGAVQKIQQHADMLRQLTSDPANAPG